jgi:Transposase and inactivated derivatives
MDCSNETGRAAPDTMNGHKPGRHKPNKIADAHGDGMRQRRREHVFVLRRLVRELASERALKIDDRSVWPFVHTETLSYQKGRLSPVSAITATSPGGVARWGSCRGRVVFSHSVFNRYRWFEATIALVMRAYARNRRDTAPAP